MVCCNNATFLVLLDCLVGFVDNGRVEVAGFPMITQPSGVLVANWHLSLLHVTWFWVWACMQSLPMRRMVGHSLLVGNLDAK